MGRRKQFCPQKTGAEDFSNGATTGPNDAGLVEAEETGAEKDISGLQQGLAKYLNESGMLNPYAAAIQLAQLQAALTQSAGFQQLAAAAAVAASQNAPNGKGIKRKAQEDSPLDLSGPAKAIGVGPSSFSIAALAGKSPLQQMKDLSAHNDDLKQKQQQATASPPVATKPNARLAQWLSQGPDAVSREIFKCVNCGDNFPTLQALTTHMKLTGHFSSSSSSASSPSPKSALGPPPKTSPIPQPSPPKRDLLREQLPMPRKLVRGQDVWLGRGEEQTKNILKCMYCGQSFRSLDALTIHMQETKHYTKVMSSHEQIGVGNNGNNTWKGAKGPGGAAAVNGGGGGGGVGGGPKKNFDQINSIFACKVCRESFGSLHHLTEHIVKNNHYGGGASPASPAAPTSTIPAIIPAAAEKMLLQSSISRFNDVATSKKTKSLPVKTLLEMERNRQRNNRLELSLSPPILSNCSSAAAAAERPESTKSSASSSTATKSILGDLEELVSRDKSKSVSSSPSSAASSPPSQRKTGGSSSSSGPLAALQMLCDTAENEEAKPASAAAASATSKANEAAGGGSILAFSWACMESSPSSSSSSSPSSSSYKCRFCDTPFVSKGAYRHHLSKVHFMKDGGLLQLGTSSSSSSAAASNAKDTIAKEASASSSQSKYHKYAELAKQLSSTPTGAKSPSSTASNKAPLYSPA